MIDSGMKAQDLYIEGMHCKRCVQKVSRSLSNVEGVDTVEVEIGHARISYLPQLAGLEDIKRAAETAGYAVHLHPPQRSFWQRFLNRLIRSNESMFGSKAPDCCSIVRDQQKGK